jgi:hypothetical protein
MTLGEFVLGISVAVGAGLCTLFVLTVVLDWRHAKQMEQAERLREDARRTG